MSRPPASERRTTSRIEDAQQALEVARARGREEGVDDLPLAHRIGVRGIDAGGAAHPSAGPTRELPSGRGRAADDRGDLVERDAERVMQDERQPFRRRQRLEDDEEREAHRIGQEQFLLGIGGVGAGHDRFGHVDPDRILAPGLARSKRVKAQARDDRRQPAAEIVDLGRVARLMRNQASCTTSSASVRDPSIR